MILDGLIPEVGANGNQPQKVNLLVLRKKCLNVSYKFFHGFPF